MDDEAESQQKNLMDLEELGKVELDDEDCGMQMLPQEPNGSLNGRIQHIGNGQTDLGIHWIESSGLSPAYPVCVARGRWTMSGEEEDIRDNLLQSCCPAGGSRGQRSPSATLEYWMCPENEHNMEDNPIKTPVSTSVPPHINMPHLSTFVPGSVRAIACPEVSNAISDTRSPFGCLCGLTSSAWDVLSSTSRSPRSSDQGPVSAAAHLHLLGESLSLIGHHLKKTDKTVCMSSSFSLLLDSLLCALAPLMCLTTQVPELTTCTEYTLDSTLENVAYVMPGL